MAIARDGEPRPGERFDGLPLLVATDGAVAAFSEDPRRVVSEPGHRRRGGPGRARLAWAVPPDQRSRVLAPTGTIVKRGRRP